MANSIKYSTTGVTNTISKGNFYLGVNSNIGGPTHTTGFWSGIQPPLSGYTLYGNKNDAFGPSINVFNNDAELISFVNQRGGNVSTISGAINYFSSNDELILVDKDYEPIVTDGLVLNLDASFTPSYSRTGTTWNDISGNGNNGTLVNGPGFSGGSISFDGADDYCLGTIPFSIFTGPHSICCWFYRRTITQWSGLFSNNVNNNSCSLLTFIDLTNKIGINQTGVSATDISIDLGLNHLNKWIYCVLVISGVSSGSNVNVYAYMDGSLLTSSGNLYWNMKNTSSYYVARHYGSGSQILDGFIPQVSVYNRALSASEVLQNYNAGFHHYTNTLQNRVQADGGYYEDTTNYTTEIIKKI